MPRPYLVTAPSSGTQTTTGALAVTGGILSAQSVASFTIPTGYNCLMLESVTVAGSSAITIQGTGTLAVIYG